MRAAFHSFPCQVRSLQGILGGVVDPHAAYLLLRGIKTLRQLNKFTLIHLIPPTHLCFSKEILFV